MKEFTDLIGGTTGAGKSLEEIRATTAKIPKSANHVYGAKVPEWDATLPNTSQLTRDDFIRNVEPRNDRILVQLLPGEERTSSIVLVGAKPLIGGCRKARVLKTGPGRWIEGEWWKVHEQIGGSMVHGRDPAESFNHWKWFSGYRRPVSVLPGQVVLIGNWVDLELEDIALCQEMDVRAIWN